MTHNEPPVLRPRRPFPLLPQDRMRPRTIPCSKAHPGNSRISAIVNRPLEVLILKEVVTVVDVENVDALGGGDVHSARVWWQRKLWERRSGFSRFRVLCRS